MNYDEKADARAANREAAQDEEYHARKLALRHEFGSCPICGEPKDGGGYPYCTCVADEVRDICDELSKIAQRLKPYQAISVDMAIDTFGEKPPCISIHIYDPNFVRETFPDDWSRIDPEEHNGDEVRLSADGGAMCKIFSID